MRKSVSVPSRIRIERISTRFVLEDASWIGSKMQRKIRIKKQLIEENLYPTTTILVVDVIRVKNVYLCGLGKVCVR